MTTTSSILVVDDDPMMVRTLCDVLRYRGFRAEGAPSGEAALTAIGARPWDAIVMDVKMTGISGVEVARRLRRSHPQLPVILMSAFTEPETLLVAGDVGVERVLTKPVRPSTLFQTLEVALSMATSVLIVDDDPTFLQTLGDALAARRIRTLRTRTLACALDLLRDHAPQVVLLDLVLAETKPCDAARAIHAASPSVQIVLYSGHQSLLDETAATLPPDCFRAIIRKPSLLDELQKVLHADNSGRSP